MTTETKTLPDQIEVWVRGADSGSNVKVTLPLDQFDEKQRTEIGRAAAEGGMRLHIDAAGFYVGNWSEHHETFGDVLEAARAYNEPGLGRDDREDGA